MQLTVKTLKGGKFQVECDGSCSVSDVKRIIENTNSELPAENMKLIHSGKVLKDDDSIESCGIKPNDFLVVMVTKPKKPAAIPEAPAAIPPAAAVPAAPASAATATPPPPVPASDIAPAPATTTTTTTTATTDREATTAAAPAAIPADEFPPEIVANLTSIGFPEAEVRHCLRAANGNPNVAVEFLTHGIPPGVQGGGSSSTGAAASAGGPPLQALRNHPQFNDLRRLVQSNPQMLQQVLTQIGQQQPELLQEINANQAAFLEMMNEPVGNTAPAAPAAPTARSRGRVLGGLPGMANPMQMNEIIQNMSPEELNQMAATMGVTPEQLRVTAQLVGQMPPDQFQEHMMQAMQQMPADQLQEYMLQAMQQGAAMDDDGGGGGMLGGPQILRLTEEEMAAVDRLTEMGFDRAEAAQAFLACDKNEALAANLLMDSMADGGGAFGFGSGDGDHDGDDDGDDEMYD